MGSNDSGQPPRAPSKLDRGTGPAGGFRPSAAGLIAPLQALRTHVWTWSFVRLAVAACATWLGWRYKNAGAGPLSLALSLLLFAFSLLVRARHQPQL